MRVVVVVLLAGCNAVLGLDRNTQLDTPPPVDAAPFPCLPFPSYVAPATSVHGCTDYTTDADGQIRAVATCAGATEAKISEGMPGSSSLTPAIFDSSVPSATFDVARLFPGGDRMVVRAQTPQNLSHPVGFYVFYLQGGMWLQQYELRFADLDVGLMTTDKVSTPTTDDSNRHIIVAHYDAQLQAQELREYAQEPDPTMPWRLKNIYTPAGFDQINIGEPYLSADGLALVFVAGFGTGFPRLAVGLRTDIRDAFVMPNTFETWNLTDESAPFLTRDCSKLYLTTSGETQLATPK